MKRLWIPLVVLLVLTTGGFTVSRLHGIFGSEKSLSYGDTTKDKGTPADAKHMKYEVFGPPGTPALVSYFGEDGNPKHENVILPWSLEFPISAEGDIGSVAAQGESSTIGCRITMGGVVKSEESATHEVSTFVSCLLKAS
ncbi:MmpS family transport accessory protein [Mycolicibacterium rhodesiae]|uniref:Uncharacterized protein n=1 Tax=Mycolicibacterium rhodesiae TaxID=36814 RepID=A0A1X0IMR2_MYCRH|nr:MmpS family transport accessory protein [Mycolicibacterium rhodesiae]MCV7347627.1 hypothetical protein [Mycolicibacterium rhodesiae]ORB49277.1 hypothetical protein BST42_23730 [Mycolicibacterium rhodesiae]